MACSSLLWFILSSITLVGSGNAKQQDFSTFEINNDVNKTSSKLIFIYFFFLFLLFKKILFDFYELILIDVMLHFYECIYLHFRGFFSIYLGKENENNLFFNKF